MKTEIGMIGLGVMGKSLSRNLARNGFRVSIYNRHLAGSEEDVAINFKSVYPELKHTRPFDDLKMFVQSMETPRKIILMVNAGPAVDAVLQELSTYLEPADIVIDGGNSHFDDTSKRIARMNGQGFEFLGCGISGGEEGALKGPSMMPSGNLEAYDKVRSYLEKISAKDENGDPCCTYIGNEGSGHFVKMIHNGVEYVEMQLLAECYSIFKSQDYSNDEIADEFESWKFDLGSYLLDITIDILRKKEKGKYLLDQILDKAGNKGTGNWATVAIADSGEPGTMIPASLFARYLSFFKERRTEFASVFSIDPKEISIDLSQLKAAYQFARIINHYQGFSVISGLSNRNDWNVNLSEVARIWTEGCIIKSDLMKDLVKTFQSDQSILSNTSIIDLLENNYQSAKKVAVNCIDAGIHAPCLLEAVNFFHGLRTADSSANLIQAQRDYFGAHTYQRVDDSSGKFYHTNWSL